MAIDITAGYEFAADLFQNMSIFGIKGIVGAIVAGVASILITKNKSKIPSTMFLTGVILVSAGIAINIIYLLVTGILYAGSILQATGIADVPIAFFRKPKPPIINTFKGTHIENVQEKTVKVSKK